MSVLLAFIVAVVCLSWLGEVFYALLMYGEGDSDARLVHAIVLGWSSIPYRLFMRVRPKKE